MFSWIPVEALEVEQEAADSAVSANPFWGKTLSILGDSISTYQGISNNTSYNATLGRNTVYYAPGTLGVYRADTWWQQVIDALDMELLVNNSWSGSCVLNTRSGTVGAYVDRCVQLHDNAGNDPDVIAVFLGTNDFSYYQDTLGTAAAVNYATLITDNGDGTYTYAAPATTCEAYAIMLHRMTERYPDAEIYCLTLTARRDPDYTGDDKADVGQPTAFNAELAEIIEHFGCTVVDLENCGIDAASDVFDVYMGDKRVHPNAQGMNKISEAVVSTLLGEDTVLYEISFNLTNVAEEACAAHTVLSGNPYTVTLIEEDGFENMTVTVTMDGEDITGTCYSDGIVSIPTVIGDVVITAQTMERDPLNFRWEFSSSGLVTVTTDGNASNALTKLAGTTTDGVFSSTRYRMERTVMLLHNRAWVMEWKGIGKGGIMLAAKSVASTGDPFFFRREASQMFAFGVYNGSWYDNYGITLPDTIDTTAEHTYRLENHIADDGANMVWLYVDGVEIGQLNNYFIAGGAQNTTSDWISGRDFIFNYIGTESHPLTNMSVDYLQIEEESAVHHHGYAAVVTEPTCTEQGYTTYTCTCEDSYVDDYVDALNHDHMATVTYPTGVIKGYTDYTCSVCGDSYRTPWLDPSAYEGMKIACVGDSITAAYGVTKDKTDYVKLLADQLGMNYIRLGASGTTLCTDGSRTCNIGKLTEANLNGADVVTIAMGINDFCAAGAGYYELGDIESTDTSTIYGAARMWCERIVELRKTDSLSDTQFYFVTPVICSWNSSVTSSRDWDQSKTNIHGYTLRDLCNAIMEVAALYDVAVIDLNLLSGMYYVDAQDNNTAEFGGDGVHPGEKGHEMMAAALANVLLQNNLRDDHAHTFGSWITTTWPTCLAGEQQRVCSVCSAAESRTLEPDDNHQYCAVVTPPTDTQQGYTTYTCSICGDSYVGDYTDPISLNSYRWEMQDNTMVSVTTGGNTANALTLDSGSITDGTLTGVRYTLQSEVRLNHDAPWVIEWRSTGNWSGMLFGSTAQSPSSGLTYLFRDSGTKLFAFGEYNGSWNNYGMILDCDMTVPHVFRLENRIAADGSNAVYLLVDGQEIDAMHHYFIIASNQNKTVNWANGRDIVFANIGTTSHPVKGMKLDYLQVWENGEPATEPEWEIGSIYASSGTNFSSNTRLRTVEHLLLADYTGITVGRGYSITYLVYDADKNYLGNGSETQTGNWLGDGVGISFEDVLALYPDAVYFRVVLCATNGAEVTLEDVETSGIAFRTAEEDKVMWEQGTIASATGLNNVNSTRLRTADYLLLKDYGGVGINRGYTMTNFVYDQDYNYLGTSSWLGSGIGFETEDLQEKYPKAVYFRIALRTEDSKNISVSDVEATGVTFYGPGEDVPVRNDVIKHTVVGNIGAWQDGAIFGGKLFVFNGVGSGAVYDLDTLTKLGTIALDRTDVLIPHANSVCFGNTYYAEEDQYPLLYINVYNNYASSADRMEGTCCVYRLTEKDGVYTTDLVQVIRIGFVEDLTLWKSKENNGDTRPYGNFLVDTDNHKLYAYVMRDASITTRFFRFDLPTLTDGAYNETYGCNVVTLESSEIETYFDTSYFNYLQGSCYFGDQILSVEGFSNGTLRIVDLDQQKLRASHSLGEAGLLHEPEVLCIDLATGIIYYAAADGILRKLTIPGVEIEHTHSYTSVVTDPTCTEQGYTTYTCTSCGYSYVSDYTDKLNLTIIPITSAEVEQGGYYYGRDSKSTTRLRAADQIYVEAGTTVKYSANGLRVFFAIVSGPDANSYLEGGRWYTDSGEFKVTTDGFLSIIISKPNPQDEITVSDYTADIEIHMISECAHDYQVVVTEPTYSSGGYTTHTCTHCGHRYVTGYTDKKIYRILLIGNSFSHDSMREFAAVAQSMMGSDFDLEIHLAINAAKTMAWHATQANAGAASYKHRYYFTTNGKWIYEDDPLSTLDSIIDSKQWDVITIQSYYPEVNTGTASGLTGESAEFLSLEKSVPYMLDYIHSHAPQSKVYYFMAWQATTDTTHLDAGRKSFDQILAMTQVLEEYSGTQTGKCFDGVIPVGTAIQNARSTYLGLLNYTASRDAEVVIGLQRDSVHMAYSIGAYIAALTWAEYLFPEEVRAEGYVLSGVPKSSTLGALPVEYSEIAQKAVAAALKNPYTVNALDGYEVDPADVAKKAIESADYCFSGITNETELLTAIQNLVTSHLTKTGFDEPTITLGSYTLKNGVVTDLTATVTFRFGYTTRTVNITRHFHKYTSVVTESTCTDKGFTTYTCACGDYYVDDYVDATGHDYTDGICTLCGVRKTSTFQILDTRSGQIETFTYEVGMTWKEWLNSSYNTGMGSSCAIWVSEGPDFLGNNPHMDIFVNGAPADYDSVICEQDDLQLIKYS